MRRWCISWIVLVMCIAHGMGKEIVFGANHKTGSVLLAHIDRAVQRCDGDDVLRFNSHFAGVISPNVTYVLFVRNPFQMIVSGYLYHRKGPNPCTVRSIPHKADVQGHHLLWTDARVVSPHDRETYAEYLKRVPVIDGLLAEMVRCEYREFVNARVVSEARKEANVLMVCLDDVMRSEGDFHRWLEKIFDALQLSDDCVDALYEQLVSEGPEFLHAHGTQHTTEDRSLLLRDARMLDVVHFNESVARLERHIECNE